LAADLGKEELGELVERLVSLLHEVLRPLPTDLVQLLREEIE
jgi:hypothetical protein